MLAAATLVYCLFVFDGGEKFFRDSDTGWHIRNGESILAAGVLPRADAYSFSKAGEPWIPWEWGSDVVMALAHRMGGLGGVAALVALAISACTWMCCRLHFAAGGDFFLAALLTPPMLTTASMHWLARPHVFSWLFLVGAVLFVEQASARGTGFSLWKLAAIAGATAIWANLHASFFLAPVIAMIYAVSHLLRPLLWPLDRDQELARARWFAWAALASLAGSFLNPQGWRLHQHVLAYLRNEELTSRVAEFQSFNFHDAGAWQVTLAVALAVAAGIVALTQKKVAHFLLAALLVWGGLRSARVLPLMALVMLPLANGAFTEALREAWSLQPRLKEGLDRALGYSARLRALDLRVNGAAFYVLAILVALLAMRAPAYSAHIGFSPTLFPTEAAAAVEKLPASSRLLASDSYGGYLIYRFHGERKVFCDGRSDLYGAEFMKQYLALMEAKPGWRETVESWGFTHALLPDDSPLAGALEQAGWIVLYRDQVATLLAEAAP